MTHPPHPSYLTILKWLHYHKISDYNVSRDMLGAIMSGETLAAASAANLIDVMANDRHTTPEELATSINQWAEQHAEMLDTLSIGLRPKPASTAKSTPSHEAPSTHQQPPSWTSLAKQFGRVVIGASANGKHHVRGWGKRVEGWMGERAERAAVVALELAARADGVAVPLVVTRDTLLAILFDGEQHVPKWVKKD